MADGIKTTIKKFENTLYTKHGVTDKSEHFENGWGDNGPEVKKLWLYHFKGKHVGTYNRKERVAFLIG
jgi:hypothetical protein